MKPTNKILSVKLIFFLSSIFLLLIFSYLNYSRNIIAYNENKKIFYIEKGESVTKTIRDLKDSSIISSTLRFKIISYMYNINPKFISGKYRISKNDTELSILEKFLDGNLYQEKITIIEGSSFKEIIKLLVENNHINNEKNINFSEPLRKSSIKFLTNEGMCFPDTYKFSSGTLLKEILISCSQKMESILLDNWKNRDYSLPYKSPYEMLIMASIIEKESSDLLEKPLIASVFINRLRKEMRLQADPTVIYGIKNFNGNITKKDLREKNEYNTYKISGLPRTPICSPSESSIRAASRPAESKFLFFVANNNGKHIFSTNYRDHVNAVNKYQKK